MSPLLYSLIGISLTLIIILIYGLHSGNDDSVGGSIVGLVLIGIFGFGLWAGLIGTYKVYNKPAVVYEVVKGRHVVVVCTNDEDHDNVIFDGYDVDKIDSNSKFFWEAKCNHYGVETSRSLKYINEK